MASPADPWTSSARYRSNHSSKRGTDGGAHSLVLYRKHRRPMSDRQVASADTFIQNRSNGRGRKDQRRNIEYRAKPDARHFAIVVHHPFKPLTDRRVSKGPGNF